MRLRSGVTQMHRKVPVFISGYDSCREPFNEVTETSEISVDGGFVELLAPIAKEHPFLLINMATGRAAACGVASLQIAPNGKARVGIHFALPSPEFWGVEFRLEKEVDQAIQQHLEPAPA